MKILIFFILLVVFALSFVAATPAGGGSTSALHIFLVSGACLSLMIYLAPAMHAYKVRHPDRSMILFVNLIAGWTILLWIAAFMVACNGKGSISTPAVIPPPIPEPSNLTDQLRELDSLKNSGLITVEEYRTKRSQLLS
ncbi:MAG: superinfection immunity protein [Luteolibacter sp.]